MTKLKRYINFGWVIVWLLSCNALSGQDFWKEFRECSIQLSTYQKSVQLDMKATQENVVIDQQQFIIANSKEGKYLKAFDQEYILENGVAIIIDHKSKSIKRMHQKSVDRMMNLMLESNEKIEAMKDFIFITQKKMNDVTEYSLFTKEGNVLLSKIQLDAAANKFIKTTTYPTTQQVAQRFEGVEMEIIYNYNKGSKALSLAQVFTGGNLEGNLTSAYASYDFNQDYK